MCRKFVKSFKHIEKRAVKLAFSDLPWIPTDLARSLHAVTCYLRDAFGSKVSRIGLYGSWQRGDPRPESDVDIVVFLSGEVSWFDTVKGVVNHSDARKDHLHWHIIEENANTRRLDSRIYSITVVTQGMVDYYTLHGPIHLQNWVHAMTNCHLLWRNQTALNEGRELVVPIQTDAEFGQRLPLETNNSKGIGLHNHG